MIAVPDLDKNVRPLVIDLKKVVSIMYNNKSFLAIIPARGGSKRLPRKNVLDLGGKPLLAWTIEAAEQSEYLDEVIVSSDDDEIIRISEQYGARVVIKRPPELATDTATSIDVCLHAIELYKKQHKKEFHYVVFLQPTSPLRDGCDIDGAIEYCMKKKGDAVLSVCETEHSPLWNNVLPDDLSMENFIPRDVKDKRSQDLPVYYRLNGAIYICKTEKLREERSFLIKQNVYAYIMSRMKSVDIDTELDLKFAELILSRLSAGEKQDE